MRLRVQRFPWDRKRSASPAHGPFKRIDELLQTDPKRSAERTQLHYIDPALTAFAFADEGLGFANPFGQVNLGEAGPPPGLPKDLEEEGVLGRVDGFFHCEPGAMELP